MKLAIFPGHHPTRPGACYNGLVEHDEAKKVVDVLIPILEPKFEIITLVGNLTEKAILAKQTSPDYIFDIHFNADEDDDTNDLNGRGTEILINPQIEKKDKLHDLAESISSSISISLEIPNRGIKLGWDRTNPQKPYYVLGQFPNKSLIIEILFIDNKKEQQLLINKEYLKIASSVAFGIQRSIITPGKIKKNS